MPLPEIFGKQQLSEHKDNLNDVFPIRYGSRIQNIFGRILTVTGDDICNQAAGLVRAKFTHKYPPHFLCANKCFLLCFSLYFIMSIGLCNCMFIKKLCFP